MTVGVNVCVWMFVSAVATEGAVVYKIPHSEYLSIFNSNTRFVTLKIVFLNKTEPRQTGQMLWNLVCDGNYFLTDLSCRWKELC